MNLKIYIFLLLFCGNLFSYPLWLHTSRTQITNSKGNVVILRGVNFGSWLLNELWMTDFQPKGSNLTCDTDIRFILNKRFGKKKANQLIDIYQLSYINEQDFDNVKTLGFNCIRLPFLYKILEDDDKPGIYKKDGWNLWISLYQTAR